MNDEIKIEVLEDGTIKVSTDQISAANHASAEAFLREAARLAGGNVKTETKHTHGHAHVHTDQTINQ
jgi:hypothetical protein